MSDMIKVKLEDATNAQLRYYCEAIINLDGIKAGQSNSHLIAKVRAAQGEETEVIELPPESVHFAPARQAAVDIAPTPEGDIPSGPAGQHYRYDPKAEITIAQTSDKTRSRDVQVAVNGDVIIVQRGKRVAIPYRFYLALDNAIEKIARDTDEINPQSQMPVKEWVDQPSYSYTTHRLPSDEEIAAWHKRTDNNELKAGPAPMAAAA